MRRTVLTIAGSDPSGGAGIQADLKAFAAHGAYGAAVVTALTVQNTRGVRAAEVMAPELVRAQIDAVFDDLDVAAVKTGMLGAAPVVREVARALAAHPAVPVVVDPVMISKSGHALLPEAAIDSLIRDLLPRADLATPNVHEASALTGRSISTVADAETAGRRILELGARAVLVKGGHLAGEPGTDVLVTASRVTRFEGEWVDTPHTHGTGCTYSAAIATGLARGLTLEAAVGSARAFLRAALRAATAVGGGVSPTEPLFFLRSAAAASAWADRLAQARVAPRRPGALHVLTDATLQQRYGHVELARLAAEAGADVIQFREKRPWTTAELVRTAEAMARALEGTGARLVVNDRADVAAASRAAGVHLGRHDLRAADARALLGDAALIGGTANDLAEARAVAPEVDYLGVGPVFGTTTKANPAPALGLQGLESIARAVDRPVIAIGSIRPEHVPDVIAAGACGVAVASAVVADADPAAVVRRLRGALDAALGRSR